MTVKPPQKNRHWPLLVEVAARRDRAAEEAIRLFEAQADFAGAQVRMRERMEEAARDAPIESRAYGTPARLEYVLGLLDMRAEACLELVSDIRLQNAFMTILEYLERAALQEYSGYLPEVLKPVSAEAHSAGERMHAKVQRWTYEGYKRLKSFSKTPPELQSVPQGEAPSNSDEAPHEPSPTVSAPNPGDDVSGDRRAAVNAYIEEVFHSTKKRITRKDIWQAARYTTRTEFERWERHDQKYPNQSAHERFSRILRQKPHLK